MMIANAARAIMTTAAGVTLALLAQGFRIEAARLSLIRTAPRAGTTPAVPSAPVSSPKRRTHWPKR